MYKFGNYYTLNIPMKLTNILKTLILALAMILSASCEKVAEQTNGNSDAVTITLDVDKLNLESASIRVRHDGAADLIWAYMMTDDLTTDADVLINEKIARDLELTGEIVVYTGQNKSLQVTDLAPKSFYRFICKAVDPETGNTFGEVAEIKFRTRRDPSVFEVNENWNVERGERVINPDDRMEYDTFNCTSTDDETYVVLPIKAEDFKNFYANDLRALFEDYHSSYNLPEGDNQWKSIVMEGDHEWREQRLRHGEWCIFMFGIDDDGEISGHYYRYDLTIEEETATAEYLKWIGTWEIYAAGDTKLFDIVIIPSENNMWYYMGGWESDNIFAFDTFDYTLMPELFFDKGSSNLCFVSQYVNTMISESDNIDFYFSGTFTYVNTYVLGNEVLNFRMAEAVNVTDVEAMIKPNNFSTSGMEFPMQAICYIYYNGSQPSAISLAPPTLPLTMKKVVE